MDSMFIEVIIWSLSCELESDFDKQISLFEKIYSILSTYHKSPSRKISNINLLNQTHSLFKRVYLSTFKESKNSELENSESGNLIQSLQNGRYKTEFIKEGFISRGTYGAVFKAESVFDGEKYAIKKILLNGNKSKGIEKEVRVWAKLKDSQFIVQFKTAWTEYYCDNNYDKLKDSSDTLGKSIIDWTNVDHNENPVFGSVLHIQMELCRMTLSEAIRKINFELNQTVEKSITFFGAYIASQLFEEIVSGVGYLHSLNPPIIHRDLKPKNILITDGKNGNFVKIGDYGLATYGLINNLSSQTINPELEVIHTKKCGTDGYIAPEVYVTREYNEKCDMFSLGSIMMDLFCIKKDLNTSYEETIWDLMNNIIRQDPLKKIDFDENGFETSQSFLPIMSRLCESLPDKRPSCVDVLQNYGRWKTPFEMIKYDMKVRDICSNICNIDSENMTPLVDYIFNEKLKFEFKSIVDKLDTVGKRHFDVMKMALLIDSKNIYSNIDDENVRKIIITIINHALGVHTTPESAAAFIENELKRLDGNNWMCFGWIHSYDRMPFTHFINWKNMHFLCITFLNITHRNEKIYFEIILLKFVDKMDSSPQNVILSGSKVQIIESDIKKDIENQIIHFASENFKNQTPNEMQTLMTQFISKSLNKDFPFTEFYCYVSKDEYFMVIPFLNAMFSNNQKLAFRIKELCIFVIFHDTSTTRSINHPDDAFSDLRDLFSDSKSKSDIKMIQKASFGCQKYFHNSIIIKVLKFSYFEKYLHDIKLNKCIVTFNFKSGFDFYVCDSQYLYNRSPCKNWNSYLKWI